jgi:hypothetical protein
MGLSQERMFFVGHQSDKKSEEKSIVEGHKMVSRILDLHETLFSVFTVWSIWL